VSSPRSQGNRLDDEFYAGSHPPTRLDYKVDLAQVIARLREKIARSERIDAYFSGHPPDIEIERDRSLLAVFESGVDVVKRVFHAPVLLTLRCPTGGHVVGRVYDSGRFPVLVPAITRPHPMHGRLTVREPWLVVAADDGDELTPPAYDLLTFVMVVDGRYRDESHYAGTAVHLHCRCGLSWVRPHRLVEAVEAVACRSGVLLTERAILDRPGTSHRGGAGTIE